ncbi:MAG TPA: GNAT family N-acetyltransferase [Pyrinomonadaceae bacterium]|nr:GNAT family N-acetyltransferase [Pyrinomonadaceae bacterium]
MVLADSDSSDMQIREVTTFEEYDACLALQREAFGMPDLELSPRRHLIVARAAGGWTLGAFDAGRLVGFVLTQVALRARTEVFGYSHMMAVARDSQNRGVGARLKWAQRERAIGEGWRLLKWTFEPTRARNAHFNLNRLGVVVRRYEENFYGTDYATQADEQGAHEGLASDRLVAEWELDSPRVETMSRGDRPNMGDAVASVEIPPDWTALVREDVTAARRELGRVRAEFQSALARGLVCAGFERDPSRPRYLFFSES